MPITDLMLIEEAKNLADVMNIDYFKASNGWSEGFKKCATILFASHS
jgi:hypothetical protein